MMMGSISPGIARSVCVSAPVPLPGSGCDVASEAGAASDHALPGVGPNGAFSGVEALTEAGSKALAEVKTLPGAGVAAQAEAGAGATAAVPMVVRGRTKRLYAELFAMSHFSLLSGASHPRELVERAAELGLSALGIADENTLAGVVRAHQASKATGLPVVVGSRLQVSLVPPVSDGLKGGGGFGSSGGSGGGWGGELTPEQAAADLEQLHEPSRGFFAPWVGGVRRGPAGVAVMPVSEADRLDVVVYPTSVQGYGMLCRLLTLGRRRAPKGSCDLRLEHLLGVGAQAQWQAVIVPPVGGWHAGWVDAVRRVRDAWGGRRLSLMIWPVLDGDDRARWLRTARLGRELSIELLAGQDVRYHDPSRRSLHDLLCCIRHNCTLDEAGRLLNPHADRCLKSPAQMEGCLSRYKRALDRTMELVQEASQFNLDQLRYQYPEETCPSDQTPMSYLAELAWTGSRHRYPNGLPEKVRHQIEHELTLIDELDYAPYFLTVYDIVKFARRRGILCQGRGAAANSAVCYCLEITSVDPDRIDLLFERFVSRERNEPPDIDVDFEHERREEVIQYIYRRFGRHRAALTAEVIRFRRRSSIRQLARALGMSLDLADRLSRHLGDRDASEQQRSRVVEAGADPDSPSMRMLLEHLPLIEGFPRHLSQHVGGFIITRQPLCDLVPIQNAAMPDRTVIEWDKDDVDAMGMLKIDILGLGMLSCVRKSLDMLEGLSPEGHRLEPATIPAEDSAVYDMVCRADTVGVFQIESRAQMSMLPRLQPRNFYDLVIEVAIVRPGPIHGKMVHPYLRRRRGEEAVTYPDERIRAVLGKTLGVPLFQEQVMAMAVAAAGFTPGEADNLRRAIAAWKGKNKVILQFGQRIVDGMLSRGYERSYAEHLFEQIKGFGEYGFPESHAASFALIVYVSAWLKCHHPAVFAAALINSQPMGFYAPAQIIRDARAHGVEVRPIDVNFSRWDCRLETEENSVLIGGAGGIATRAADGESGGVAEGGSKGPAIRLGFRLVKGMSLGEVQALEVAGRGSWRTFEAFCREVDPSASLLRKLARADAMRSLGLDRQRAMWAAAQRHDERLPLFEAAKEEGGWQDQSAGGREAERLPKISNWRQVLQDYEHTGLSLKAHPVSFLRGWLDGRRVTANRFLADERACPHRSWIQVAGLVLMRQRPSTAKGIMFITLEDETGIANLILRPKVYRRFRRAARHSVLALARGRIDRQGPVVHVVVDAVEDLGQKLEEPAAKSRDFR